MADTILTALSRTDPEFVEEYIRMGFATHADFKAWLNAGWSCMAGPPGACRIELDRERLLPEFAD